MCAGINNLFVELLKVSLGTQDCLSKAPSVEEWIQILKKAEEQAVVGMMLSGLELLPEEQWPPVPIKLQWIGEVQMNESQYRLHKSVIAKTRDCLEQGGVSVAFMKGLVCASRYQHPERRMCGDIDFVVDDTCFPKTLDLLESIGNVDRELKHEHHGMVYVDNVILEPHYKVHNFQNPVVDAAQKELFHEVFPHKLEQLYLDGEEIPVFPPAFECLVLLGHMVNHVYAEGLGLRQVIDFMFFLQKEHKSVLSEECQMYINKMQMERAFRIFVRICEEYLGMSSTLFNIEYTEKEKKFANKFFENILMVGNFGRVERRLSQNAIVKPIQSYLWVIKRCIQLGWLCPAESHWWPVAKFRRFLWKRLLSRREAA